MRVKLSEPRALTYVGQILSLQADIATFRRRQQAQRRPAKREKLLKRGILSRR